MPEAASTQELIAIGIIRRPVGLDGVCAIEPFGHTLTSLELPAAVLVGKEQRTVQEIVISRLFERPGGFQCEFEGRSDRTSVDPLRGLLLFVGAERLDDLPGNEYYHFELKGMDVVADDTGCPPGAHIGKVLDIHNYPSMDTLDVSLDKGGGVMLPLSGQAIIDVDRKGRRITVRYSFVEELLE
ncbi:MAG: ribosome maturation factor RimM [Chitinispirillaceae bacterium]|jgi:16S rRNA processing protein RimM|nr:ribosome maturation factor RimM [Chitinispirillaceae bacterium]